MPHNIDLLTCLESFFNQYSPFPSALLLGLSGGPDSLALFYALLAYQRKHPFSLHIAHVDHGWRAESKQEAEQLKQLANYHKLPFHLRTLQPNQFKGNLEMACREARQTFFAELCSQHNLEGVLLAHHAGDQIETILKRVLEGSHWSHLTGLKPITIINGLRILRPFLAATKQDLIHYLQLKEMTAFKDSSNTDERFLRARMRQTILPVLNQAFGKNISSSLEKLGKEMGELQAYFEQKMSPFLDHIQTGPFGSFLDLQQQCPSNSVEIKYLLRLFCAQHNVSLSYDQYLLATEALLKGNANQKIEKEGKIIYIDRKRLFFLKLPLVAKFNLVDIRQGIAGKWRWEIKQSILQTHSYYSSWQDALRGFCRAWLPKGDYQLGDRNQQPINNQALNKWWTNHTVPAFMRSICPVVYRNSEIVHEFLTGRSRWINPSHEEGIEIIMHYQA